MIELSSYTTGDFHRGAGKLTEVIWLLARSLFFATWIPVPSALKVAILRAFGARIGSGTVIRSRVNITFPWRFSCGDHVWIGDEVMILTLAPVHIGSNTCISQRAFLCTGSHDFMKEGFDLIVRPIRIGDHCWIAAQTFVGPGVELGPASRTLPGAVVARSVPAGTTVGGVPARSLSPSTESGQSRDAD